MTAFLSRKTMPFARIGAIAVAVGLFALALLSVPLAASSPATVGAAGSVHAPLPPCTVTVTSENPSNTSVQLAINTYSATPDAVVCIGPGVFPEQLYIGPSTGLTLRGSGSGSTVLEPPTVVGNIPFADGPSTTVCALIAVSDASGVTITGLTVNGLLAGQSARHASCNASDGASYFGVYYANSSGIVSSDSILWVHSTNGSHEIGVYADNGWLATGQPWTQSVSIVDNTIAGYGKNGIACWDVGVTCTVEGNTLTAYANQNWINGIEFVYGVTGSITGNTITGNTVHVAICGADPDYFDLPGDCFLGDGALIYNAGNGVNVSGNYMTDNDLGLYFASTVQSTAWGNTIVGPSFYGIVFDSSLSSPEYGSGPFQISAGSNTIVGPNVGILAYDANASLDGNSISGGNAGIEVPIDLLAPFHASLIDDQVSANRTGALLGDISAYQVAPGDTFLPANFTIAGDTFRAANASATVGVSVLGNATVSNSRITGFALGFNDTAPGYLQPTWWTWWPAASLTVNDLNISNAGYVGLSLNGTRNATISQFDAYQDGIGLRIISGTTDVLNQDSFIASASYGVQIVSGTANVAYQNDFIANNGAGPTYSGSHTQAFSTATNATFYQSMVGNYWSDLGTMTTYPLAGGAVDLYPLHQPTFSYPLTFTESGLPNGASWSVTIGGATHTSTSVTLSFTEPNGTYAWALSAFPANRTTTTPTGSVTIAGHPGSIGVTFTRVTFAVTFTEANLPASSVWSVELNGVLGTSTTSTISFAMVNGSSYAYRVAGISGYTTTPSGGTISVQGAPMGVPITFTPIVKQYAVYFTQSGLPALTTWSATVSGGGTVSGSAPTLLFNEPNGTYTSFAFTPTSGYTTTTTVPSVTIAGTAVSIGVTFKPIAYTVTFTEVGLPTSTLWAVVLNDAIASSRTTTASFSLIDGVYAYSIGHIAGYSFTITSGPNSPLTINGAPVNVTVTFALLPPAHAMSSPAGPVAVRRTLDPGR